MKESLTSTVNNNQILLQHFIHWAVKWEYKHLKLRFFFFFLKMYRVQIHKAEPTVSTGFG